MIDEGKNHWQFAGEEVKKIWVDIKGGLPSYLEEWVLAFLQKKSASAPFCVLGPGRKKGVSLSMSGEMYLARIEARG